MRTGGPASAGSAHTSMESAPLPVRLTENGLTADAGKKERLQRNSQAWGDSPSRRQAAMRYGHRNDAGIPVQLKVSGGTAETSLLRKGRPWNLFGGGGPPFPLQACSGFSQENGTGAHTLYRIYRFGRAILLLNRVKILKKRCYEAQKEEISPYTEAKRSVEK